VLGNFTRHKRPVMIGSGLVVFHWLATDDFARVVVNAHLNWEARNRTFTIHGPEVFSVYEALEKYCAVLLPEAGKVLRIPFWAANLLACATDNRDLKHASELLAYFEEVGEPGDPTEANETLGAPTTTLDEWLALQLRIGQESQPDSQ